MRLLFVIDCLGSGGAQRQMVNLSLGLRQRSHTVEFFVYYPEKDHFSPVLKEAGIQIHMAKKSSRFSLSTIIALRNLIRRGHYDLILSFLPTPNFYTLLAGFSIWQHPPLVVSERSSDLGKKIFWTDRLARSLYRVANHIVVNSHHQREFLAQKYPYMRRKLSTIYNGYDLAVFAPKNSPLMVADSILRVLVIASISPQKNGLCLVQALSMLSGSYGIPVSVSWAGAQVASVEALSYRELMDCEINKYGLAAQWQWLGQRTDIVDLITQHDIVVHPSYIEGLPNAVCEALACGCPVLVTDALDHRFLVRDDVTGFLFDGQDPADLAEKIYHYASLPKNTRVKMGWSARRFAEQQLSLDRYAQEYESLILNCL
jgi:GalNAc-alpha-(1->4)-GalNAc-alpha-(1->3)-diNAcBac-PP-undecaprenol alpha-1,4-N-acetyl-D-galactosaminyltransferase